MERKYNENPILNPGTLIELTREEVCRWFTDNFIMIDDGEYYCHDTTHPHDDALEIDEAWLLNPDSKYQMVLLKSLNEKEIENLFIIFPDSNGDYWRNDIFHFVCTGFPYGGDATILPDTISLKSRSTLPGFRNGYFVSDGRYDTDHPIASSVLDNINNSLRLYEVSRFYHNQSFSGNYPITIRDCRGVPYGTIKEANLINKFHNFMLYHHQYINLSGNNERSLGTYVTIGTELIFTPNDTFLNAFNNLTIPLDFKYKEHTFIRDPDTKEIVGLGDGFMEYGLSMYQK